MTHTCINCLGAPLTLKSLTILKWTDEGGREQSFSLQRRVSAAWRKFGKLLDFKFIHLRGLEQQYRGVGDDCWDHVMQHWMDGGSKSYPPTWQGLYSLLKDVGFAAVTIELKEAVENPKKGSSDTPLPNKKPSSNRPSPINTPEKGSIVYLCKFSYSFS